MCNNSCENTLIRELHKKVKNVDFIWWTVQILFVVSKSLICLFCVARVSVYLVMKICTHTVYVRMILWIVFQNFWNIETWWSPSTTRHFCQFCQLSRLRQNIFYYSHVPFTEILYSWLAGWRVLYDWTTDRKLTGSI